jgi:hypothetical protein
MTTPIPDERAGLPSASGMEQVANCPDSRRMQSLCPPEAPQEVTLQGTLIALARETGDDSFLSFTESDIVERLKAQEEQMVADWVKEYGVEPVEVQREVRFWVRDQHTLEPMASAKPDVVFLNAFEDAALIIDDKSGFLDPTPAPSNWQLRTQAVALWHEYPRLTRVRVAWSRARLGQRSSHADYTREDLVVSQREIARAVWNSLQPDASRHSGKWCKYCRAKAVCHEAHAYAMVPLAQLGVPTTKGAIEQRVALLPPSALAAIKRKATLITAILDAVTANLKALPPETLDELGFKFQIRKPVDIKDLEGVWNACYANGLFADRAEFNALLKLNMGDLEKKVLKKLAEKKDLTQESAKVLLRDIISDSTEVKETQALVEKN